MSDTHALPAEPAGRDVPGEAQAVWWVTLVIGILAFVHPGDSFSVLATIFAFYLLLRGLHGERS